MIHMPFLSRDLINTNIYDTAQIPILQAVVHDIFNRFSNCIPMKAKELPHHVPCHYPSPCSQDKTEGNGQWTFPSGPGDLLDLHATLGAAHTAGRINQNDGNPPKGDVFPLSLGQGVVSGSATAAARTHRLKPSISSQPNYQFTTFLGDPNNTMPLEIQGLSDYTFNEHESYPPSQRFRHHKEVLDLIHAFKFL